MVYVLGPPADALWASMSVVIDEHGTLEKAPQTDEEWEVARGYAIQLAEASNLLQIPGRAIARPGETPQFPGIDLEFDEIERLIDSDRAAWNEFAHDLHDKSMAVVQVIDAQDAEGLYDVGAVLYEACEACHKTYWFPSGPPRAQ